MAYIQLSRKALLETRRCNKLLFQSPRSITHTLKPDVLEPAYLEELRPKTGYYDKLNLQLKGYDFTVLEKYQSYLHRVMNGMKFNVINAYSGPHHDIQLDILAHRSTAINQTHKLKLYERNIMMKSALTTKLNILIDYIHATSPPGVTFTISEDVDDKYLYFKDSVLEKYKEELRELEETPIIGA